MRLTVWRAMDRNTWFDTLIALYYWENKRGAHSLDRSNKQWCSSWWHHHWRQPRDSPPLSQSIRGVNTTIHVDRQCPNNVAKMKTILTMFLLRGNGDFWVLAWFHHDVAFCLSPTSSAHHKDFGVTIVHVSKRSKDWVSPRFSVKKIQRSKEKANSHIGNFRTSHFGKVLIPTKVISEPPILAIKLTILHNQQHTCTITTMAGKCNSKRNRSVNGTAPSNKSKKKRSSKATNGMNAIDDAASSNATRGVAVNPTIDDDTGGGATSSNETAELLLAMPQTPPQVLLSTTQKQLTPQMEKTQKRPPAKWWTQRTSANAMMPSTWPPPLQASPPPTH